MVDVLELETPYAKGSQKATPPKADHKHEYFRAITYMRIRRFNGTITDTKYQFSLPAECIDCGHHNRKVYSTALEIEVSPREYKKLMKKGKF